MDIRLDVAVCLRRGLGNILRAGIAVWASIAALDDGPGTDGGREPCGLCDGAE